LLTFDKGIVYPFASTSISVVQSTEPNLIEKKTFSPLNPDAEIFYPEYLKDLSKNKTISLTTSDAKISHFENSDQILPYPVENEFKHLNLSTGVLDSSNCRVCDEVRELDVIQRRKCFFF
jgi:hypothetical protein